MWICPKCNHKFYNRNQSHSCGNYTVEDYLQNKSSVSKALFHHFMEEYKKIGDFDVHPVKTRVALLTKMRFCSVNKIGEDHISVHFVLTAPYHGNECFYRIENIGDRFFLHHFKMYRKEDINAEVKRYMQMAYDIGNRAHVKTR